MIIEVHIDSDYITLGKFLKMESLIQSGGEAKIFLLEKDILINNIKENRRGKKLYKNDIIEIEGYNKFQIK